MRSVRAVGSSLATAATMLLVALGVARAEYLGSKVCEGSACKLESANFRVLYESGQTTDAFADHILVAFETAYDAIFDDMGYALPSEMADKKIDVTIKDLRGRSALGVAWTSNLFASRIEISLEDHFIAVSDGQANALHRARSTVGHELFHLVQASYIGWGSVPAFYTGGKAQTSWLAEATASWIEQHIFKPSRAFVPQYSYFDRMVGPEHWRHPISATTLPAKDGESAQAAKQRQSEASNRAYEASSFFQFLTENHKDGNALVRTLYEQLGEQTNPDVWSALSHAVGGKPGFTWTFRDLIAEFSVAAFVIYPSFHPDYSFDQLHSGLRYHDRPKFDPAEAGGIDPEDKKYFDDSRSAIALDGATIGALSGSVIEAVTRAVPNLAFDYVELTPFPLKETGRTVEHELSVGNVPDPMSPVDIEIAVAASGDDWAFHLLEVPLDAKHRPQKDWTVRAFEIDSDDTSTPLLVKDFGDRKRVVVVAASLRPNDDGDHEPKREWKLLAGVVEPLVVTKVVISDLSQLEVFWSLDRSSRAQGGWTTNVPVSTGIPHRPGKSIHVRIELNRAAEGPLTLRLGKLSWKVPSVAGPASGVIFEAAIKIDELAILHLEEGEATADLVISIDGEDDRGLGFDGNPETPPELFAFEGTGELKDWESDAIGAPGGPDRLDGRLVPLHRMTLPPILQGVRVYQTVQGKRTLVYDAGWKRIEGLSIRRLEVRQAADFDPQEPAELELEFSEKMATEGLSVLLEGNAITVAYDGDREHEIRQRKIDAGIDIAKAIEGTGSVYTGTIAGDIALLDIMMEKGELVLAVKGRTPSLQWLDGDPSTQAYYDHVADKWDGYDGEEGFTDRHHKLGVRGRSYVLLLDASGSMEDGRRLATAKAGILEALQRMTQSDEVALVAFYDCQDIRLEQGFTTDREALWTKVDAVQPGAGTPLGDATLFARRYMEQNARYANPKLLVFSDGASNCGQNTVASAAKPPPKEKATAEPETSDDPELASATVAWWSYRIETQTRTYGKLIDVVEVYYEEAEGDRPWGRLTVKRYPVSTLTSSGRTIWSIGWASGETEDSQRADGEGVAELRALAERWRVQGVGRQQLGDAVAAAIGPGAEALSSR